MISFNIYKSILLLLILSAILSSCTDIMDPDISAKKLILLSPSDSLETTLSTHIFWWEDMEYAEEYVLQIARPDFYTIEQIVLDTIVTDNAFTIGLNPSAYEWRVQGVNTRSETDFETRSLFIFHTDNISNEILQLKNPSEYDTTNLTQIIFKWVNLYNADSTLLKLEYDDSSVYSRTTEKDTMIINIDEGDGAYIWKIKAKNTNTETDWFQRSFFLDTDAPEVPALNEPADNATMNDEQIEFSWTRDQTDDSSIKDSLVIIKNTTPVEIKVAALLSETMYADSLGPGTYTWYVRSVDKAGNLSNKSVERTLNIQ